MPAGYYPPEGEELKIAKKVNKLLDQYSKIPNYSDSPTVFIDHVLEGVRCNGLQRVTSLLDIVEEMSEFEERLILDIEGCKKALVLTKKIRDVMVGFKVCSKCKGEKGDFSKNVESDYQRGPWEDCTECAGRGILKNGS